MHCLNRFRIVCVLFVLFLGSVVYAADMGIGQPYFDVIRSLPLGDKASHFALMGVFSVLANLALQRRTLRPGRVGVRLGTVAVSVAVVTEELSQIWIPGRTFDFWDLAADFLGIACGALAARLLWSYHRRKTCDAA